MNIDKYNDAWTRLLAARQSGTLEDIHDAAEALAHEARVTMLTQQNEPEVGPCSHFMVVNGHCINCHEFVGSKGN